MSAIRRSVPSRAIAGLVTTQVIGALALLPIRRIRSVYACANQRGCGRASGCPENLIWVGLAAIRKSGCVGAKLARAARDHPVDGSTAMRLLLLPSSWE